MIFTSQEVIVTSQEVIVTSQEVTIRPDSDLPQNVLIITTIICFYKTTDCYCIQTINIGLCERHTV